MIRAAVLGVVLVGLVLALVGCGATEPPELDAAICEDAVALRANMPRSASPNLGRALDLRITRCWDAGLL